MARALAAGRMATRTTQFYDRRRDELSLDEVERIAIPMAIALRTSRLLLREWHDEDAEAFAAMSAYPEAVRYLVPLPDRTASDAWVPAARDHLHLHRFGKFIVEIPDKAPFIGVVGLDPVRFDLPFVPAIEALWRLAPAYRGRGLATEAARPVIEDGFDRLGFTEIIACTVVENWPSRRVMDRLGMRRLAAEEFDFLLPRLPAGYPLQRDVLYLWRPAARLYK